MTTMRELAALMVGMTDEELDAPLVLDQNYTGEGYELLMDSVPTPLEGGGVAFACARGNLIYTLEYSEEDDE